ncbi:MAG: hypothetical protein JXA57_12705, partial [Armatimonadetes bacterium]|nr:hypothetical protein [Armatimonadota bacterium]
ELALNAERTSALVAGLTDLQLAHGGKLICGDPLDTQTAYRQDLRATILASLYPVSDALRALHRLSESQWQLLRGAGLRVTYDLTPDQREAFNLEPRVRDASAEEGRAPGGRARRGREFGPGGRGGGARGPVGPGGFGPNRLRLDDDRELSRLVMRLTGETPYPPRGQRGRGPGENEEEGPRPPGGDRGWGRQRAAESDWLSFWVDGELRGAVPLPRRLSIQLAVPRPSPLLAPTAATED